VGGLLCAVRRPCKGYVFHQAAIHFCSIAYVGELEALAPWMTYSRNFRPFDSCCSTTFDTLAVDWFRQADAHSRLNVRYPSRPSHFSVFHEDTSSTLQYVAANFLSSTPARNLFAGESQITICKSGCRKLWLNAKSISSTKPRKAGIIHK
jgi:hypothetical protein